MKSNTDKCHLIIVNNQDNDIKIGNDVITSENSVKHLGVTIDNKLNFNEHVDNISKKANNKLQSLAIIAKYLSPDKLRIIMKTFIESQFNYCPLTWMFHSRQLNSKINKLHERALDVINALCGILQNFATLEVAIFEHYYLAIYLSDLDVFVLNLLEISQIVRKR